MATQNQNIGSISAGPELNAFQNWARKNETANLVRGLLNQVIPGFQLDTQFKPDLYNPFTGSGRRDYQARPEGIADTGENILKQVFASGGYGDLNQDARLGGGLGNLAINALSGGVRGAVKDVPDVEMLFKNKVWNQVPDTMKADPAFAEAAVQQFNKINAGRQIPKGISAVPTPVAPQAVSKGRKALDFVTGKTASTARAVAQNPYKTQAAVAPVTALLNEAANSVDAEQQPVVVPEAPFVEPTDMSGQMTYVEPSAPASSPSQTMQSALAGRERIPNYAPPTPRFMQRVGDFLNPSRIEPRQQEAERRYLENEVMKRGYIDPDTALRLQELSKEADVGRQSTLQRENDTRGLMQRMPSAFDPKAIEEAYGIPAGAINWNEVQRLSREKAINPVEAIVMQMLAGQLGQMGQSGGEAPQTGSALNVPPTRN